MGQPLSNTRYGVGWVKFTGSVIFITTLVLMASQTAYLADNRYANLARWGMLALLSVLQLLRPKRQLPLRKAMLGDGIAVLFLAFAAASTVYSVAPQLTLLRAGTVVLLYTSVFWTIWHYAAAAGEDRVTDSLITAASIILLAGVVALIVPSIAGSIAPGVAFSGGRFRGIMANPNAVGMMGILFLPLVVSRYMRLRRIADLVLMALIAGSVVLSGSRNGVVAASISILYLLLRSRAWKAGLAIAALTAILYLAMTTYVSFQEIAVTEGIARLGQTSNLRLGGGRVEAWQIALPIIRQQLFFGHGFGTEELIFRGMTFQFHVGAYVHNSYLGLAYQLGVIGVAFMFIPLFALFISRQVGRRDVSIRVSGYEAMLLGGLAASFLESWIYSVGNAFAFPFWICVLLLLKSTRDPAALRTIEAQFRPDGRARTLGPRYPAPTLPRPNRQPAIPRFDPPPPNSNGVGSGSGRHS